MSTQETINTQSSSLMTMNGNNVIGKRGRGRPRPDYTVDRDRDILSFLTQKGRENLFDWTVKDIAYELQLLKKEIYASLLRLSWGNGTRTKPGIPFVYKTSRTTYRSMVYLGITSESRSTEYQDDEVHSMEDITSDSELDTTTAKWL